MKQQRKIESEGAKAAPSARRAGTSGVPVSVRVWVMRVAFSIVFFWNVLCAVQFIAFPEQYVAAYQLSGVAGEVALQGIGVAFLMWNATYPAFIVNPEKFQHLGIVVLVQQAIGLVGELIIAANLPAQGFDLLADSIARFVGFDAIGFVIMALAYMLLFRKSAA